MSDFLPVSMQNFLYCRKSELRAQISRFLESQLSSGVKSAASSFCFKIGIYRKGFSKNESDSQISEQWI